MPEQIVGEFLHAGHFGNDARRQIALPIGQPAVELAASFGQRRGRFEQSSATLLVERDTILTRHDFRRPMHQPETGLAAVLGAR